MHAATLCRRRLLHLHHRLHYRRSSPSSYSTPCRAPPPAIPPPLLSRRMASTHRYPPPSSPPSPSSHTTVSPPPSPPSSHATASPPPTAVERILQEHVTPFVQRWAQCRVAAPQQERKPLSECTVVVAMSGGIDSSLCAYLMKRSGLFGRVVGLYMHNWEVEDEWGGNTRNDGESACPSGADWRDVEAVCERLGIECHRKDFVRDYWVQVFEPMLHMYERGALTPNPDVWCNRHIKFDRMLRYAREDMGADLVVTGHYARLRWVAEPRRERGRQEEGKKEIAEQEQEGQEHAVQLLRGVDPIKDQSYFLSIVRQQSLRHTFFPLGALHKKDIVKPLAETIPELAPVCDKKESMGVCFIGKRKMGTFLDDYIEPHAGDIVSHEGQVLGQHTGLHHYTMGQGAKIGGLKEKWFVYDKDVASNVVRVCPGRDHPMLYRGDCIIRDCEWNYREEHGKDQTTSASEQEPTQESLKWWSEVLQDLDGMTLSAKVRYNQEEAVQCAVQPVDGQVGRLKVSFSRDIRGITPGQVCVLYSGGDQCIGGGTVQPFSKEPITMK